MNSLKYILKTYQVDKDQKSPIKLGITRWGSMPKIIKQLELKVGAEVGVAGGRFTKLICTYNPNFKMYAIDPWENYPGYKYNVAQTMEELYLEARSRLAPFKVMFVRDYSMNAVKMFADESLDFVFIDANHDYKHALEDIRKWSKKVRKGGIVSGHDYITAERKDISYGVKKAVDKYVSEQKIPYLFTLVKNTQDINSPSWMYIKK